MNQTSKQVTPKKSNVNADMQFGDINRFYARIDGVEFGMINGMPKTTAQWATREQEITWLELQITFNETLHSRLALYLEAMKKELNKALVEDTRKVK